MERRKDGDGGEAVRGRERRNMRGKGDDRRHERFRWGKDSKGGEREKGREDRRMDRTIKRRKRAGLTHLAREEEEDKRKNGW